MKIPSIILLSVTFSLLLSSCSQVQSSLTKASQSTAATLRSAKDKAFGEPKESLRLTKADPTRFLPASTNAQSIQRKKKSVQILAKNETSPSKPSKSRQQPTDFESFPPIELPALPATDEEAAEPSFGILPALDDSPNGESSEALPALPPLPIPEELLEVDEEAAPSAPE